MSQVHSIIFKNIPLVQVSAHIGPLSGRISFGIGQNNYTTIVVSYICTSARNNRPLRE